MNKFVELAKAKIHDHRNAVVSSNLSYGGFTIGQQVVVQDGTRLIGLFIKGAIHIKELEGLYSLRDALNEAIEKLEVDEIAGKLKNI
jgi:hypothetical protein